MNKHILDILRLLEEGHIKFPDAKSVMDWQNDLVVGERIDCDTFDRLSARGFKLNLVTGEYYR